MRADSHLADEHFDGLDAMKSKLLIRSDILLETKPASAQVYLVFFFLYLFVLYKIILTKDSCLYIYFM